MGKTLLQHRQKESSKKMKKHGPIVAVALLISSICNLGVFMVSPQNDDDIRHILSTYLCLLSFLASVPFYRNNIDTDFELVFVGEGGQGHDGYNKTS